MSTQNKKEHLAVGYLGEQFVAQWLQQQGWHIEAQGWHSRWGELDIIARQATGEYSLAFVEVKTRSRSNWDGDGLLAVTAKKQAKLWKTAQVFLTQHPHLAELPCRFDVALVKCVRSPQLRPGNRHRHAVSNQASQANRHQPDNRKIPPHQNVDISFARHLEIGKPVLVSGYTLTLVTYLEAAFSG